MQVVPIYEHLDQLVGGYKGQDKPGNRQNHRLRELPDQGEHPGVPVRRGHSHLYRDLSDLGIDGIKQALKVAQDAVNEQLFQPAREPVGKKVHRLLPLKQAGELRDQGRPQQDDTAAGHELLNALTFCLCVIKK